MVARTVCIIILCFSLSLPALAKQNKTQMKSQTSDSHQFAKSGKIKLKINTDELASKNIGLAIKNNKIAGDLCLYHSHVYDDHTFKDVVVSEFLLENISNDDAHIHYELMLKDKIGLVAKSSGRIYVPKGKNQPIRCSNIPLSTKEIKDIRSYEIKLSTKD